MPLILSFCDEVENIVERIIIERVEITRVLLLLERHLRYRLSPSFPLFIGESEGDSVHLESELSRDSRGSLRPW